MMARMSATEGIGAWSTIPHWVVSHAQALPNPSVRRLLLGPADFIADLERRLGRLIAQRAPGRKPRTEPDKQRRCDGV